MVIRRELSRRGDQRLFEVQLVGVGGQVCSTTYEMDGPETLRFATLVEAEAALWADAASAPPRALPGLRI